MNQEIREARDQGMHMPNNSISGRQTAETVNDLPHAQNPSIVNRTESGVAHIRTAVPLTEGERQRLHRILEDYFDHPLELQVEQVPDVLAGVFVQIGDTVIDGTLRGKLEALHHHLLAQSRIMISSQAPSSRGKDLS
ncbi:MAG: F0F1 ATP synthase subunit delta [Chloroflexota bacterium]|nr:F0F1 ATP synthase subunit delta [Chloroflexota bacterium]